MKARVRRMPGSVVVCCQLLLVGALLGAGPAVARTSVAADPSAGSARAFAPASLLPVNTRLELINVASQKCLDDSDDSMRPDTVMTQQSCVADHTPAEWIFTDPVVIPPAGASEAFFIKNVYSGKCLDDVTPAADHDIVQKACDPQSLPQARKLAQEWYFSPVLGASGEWYITSANSHMVLEVDARNRSILLNGDPIDQVPLRGSLGYNQVWRFSPAQIVPSLPF